MASARPPDAVCGDSDDLALPILSALIARGVDVPGDMLVIGVDDIPALAAMSPALSSVAVVVEQMGEALAAGVRAAIEAPDSPARYVPRSSTSCVATRRIGAPCHLLLDTSKFPLFSVLTRISRAMARSNGGQDVEANGGRWPSPWRGSEARRCRTRRRRAGVSVRIRRRRERRERRAECVDGHDGHDGHDGDFVDGLDRVAGDGRERCRASRRPATPPIRRRRNTAARSTSVRSPRRSASTPASATPHSSPSTDGPMTR